MGKAGALDTALAGALAGLRGSMCGGWCWSMHWHRTATERARALSVRSTAVSKLSSAGASNPGWGCESPAACWRAVVTGSPSKEEAPATGAAAGESDVSWTEVPEAASEVQAAPLAGSESVDEEEEAEVKDWGGAMQLLGRWKPLMERNRGSCQS